MPGPKSSVIRCRRLWLGRGIGTWYAPKHEIFDNQYLLTLVDSGVIGLVALLGIFIAGIYAALRVQFLWFRQRGGGEKAANDRDLALSLVATGRQSTVEAAMQMLLTTYNEGEHGAA